MTVKDYIKTDPNGIIAQAYNFAREAHKGQKRTSGDQYITHPVGTANILIDWHLDTSTIVAGLLHDTVEDTSATIDDIKKRFGEEVAFLVDGVTKLSSLKYHGTKSRAENMRKMIIASSHDLRVVFIKLADRLNNMYSLLALPVPDQKRIALETDEIYASIAYRLGMQNISGELQDLAFPFIYPKEYQWLISTTKEHYKVRLLYLQKIEPQVKNFLKENGLSPIQINFRAKRYSSLYKKLLRHNMNIEEIYDLVAMRIIVKTIPECYAVMGVIHEKWPPLPGRIKDYIAMPKPNSYRSLHTTVIGPENKIIEFQIRTPEMHEENEHGIAAHWIYKNKMNETSNSKKIKDEMLWMKQLQNWQEYFSGEKITPEEFMQTMKTDFFKERIFIITPHGDVVDLPVDSTPIDFAYNIHTEIGNSCIGAKVNSSLVPLDYKLQSGDMVEVITQKGKKPNESWLNFVKTSMAKEHIRNTIREKNKVIKNIPKFTRSEIKIITEDRIGLIKDVSSVIARNHTNIISFQTENMKGSKFKLNKFELPLIETNKIEKLILKLKEVRGVKEISYKLI